MTNDWHDSWPVFLVQLFAASIVATLWHEAGHVVAARIAGLPVLAWGLGVRKPWFWWRFRNSVFYLARPFTLGLTIAALRGFDMQRKLQFIYILGGPLATLLGLVLGLTGWAFGFESGWLTAWIVVSALLSLGSLVPASVQKGSIRFSTDARQLLNLAIRRRAESLDVGVTLGLLSGIAELLSQIGQDAGAAFYEGYVALTESQLGCRAKARQTLERAEARDFRKLDFVTDVLSLARAYLAVADLDEAVDELVSDAQGRWCNDATARFILELLTVDLLVKRGNDGRQQARQLRDRAIAADRPDWLCWADVAVFEIEGADDLDETYEALCRRHISHLPGLTKAHLLTAITLKLAEQGMLERAKVRFQESQQAIAAVAAKIAASSTRQEYLASAAVPLQKILSLAPEIASTEDLDAFVARVEKPSMEAAKPLSKGRAVARVTLTLGIAALAAALLHALLARIDGTPRGVHRFMPLLPAVVFFWFSSVITTCISLLRGERRYVMVALGVFLSVSATVIEMRVTDSKKTDPWRQNIPQEYLQSR